MQFKIGFLVAQLVAFSLIPATSYACMIFTGGNAEACAGVCPDNPSPAEAIVCTLSADLN